MSRSMLSDLTFSVVTFGCQMNKHDSERIVGMLETLGAKRVATIEESDLMVFMTCCVREAAEVRLKGKVASLKNVPLREGSPLSKRIIAIGGCIGQNSAEGLIAELPHVDVVFGTFNLASLPRLIEQALATHSPQVEVLDAADEFPTNLPSHREHPWAAWVPISIGCNNFCTYCIVPYVRGREKSRPLDEIVADVQRLLEDGVKEVTLLGQNVNSYGRDLKGSSDFPALIDAVAATGIERLRFATSHPKDISDELIQAFANHPNLMPALHLPVQSGSNRVLKAMNRRYTRERYLERVAKLRSVCPDIALSTDVIVGFPGETEEDFQQTYDLINEVGYHQVFTFLFSPRQGTPAAKMVDDTPREVIQERFERLVQLVQDKAFSLNQPETGRTVSVLVEGASKRNSDVLSGHSPKNQTVLFPPPAGSSAESLAGKIIDVKIEESRAWYLRGKALL